jgi:hypothetical protein
VYIVHTVKKDEYMEQYTQTIGKNVYTVREKIGYLIVSNGNSLSVFLSYFCLEEIVELYGMAWYTVYVN